MRKLLTCLLLPTALAGRAQSPAISGAAHTPADEAAVLAVVQAADAGWASRNVAQALTEYTPDAYWINALGIEKHGRAEIEPFLTRLFASPGFNAAKIDKPRAVLTVRFLSPGVALVHDYAETSGQLTNSGQPFGDRKTHIFRVLVKRQGHWLTDSFQVMDERERKL